MLKLSDWNNCIRYAMEKCTDIDKETGCDVRVKSYTMYDGRKGIKLQLFDEFGKFYGERCSGIWDNPTDLIEGIDWATEQIKAMI